MMGDYNLGFFSTLEREKLETVFLPNGFSVAGPTLSTRFCKTTKVHNYFFLTEIIPDDKFFFR